MKKLVLLISILALGVFFAPSDSSHAEKSSAKHEAKFRKAKKPKHGEYIIVLQKETPDSEIEEIANSLAHSHGGSVMGVFRHAIKGFGVRMPEGAAKALAKDPRVFLVEENAQSEPVEEVESYVYGYEPYGGSEELGPEAVQSGASWALDRIDQRSNPYLDGVYRYNRTGQGVDAYVVDTGILRTHNEFGGRAFGGYDWDPNNPIGVDCHGHGTHVAGLLGGRTYGSAKNVRLYAVRIADCNGNSNAYVGLLGIDWAISNFEAQVPRRPAVMNISYAFSYWDGYAGALDNAVNTAINRGITVVIAAGNFSWFTGNTAPQGSGTAVINVAATDINDVRGYFENGTASNFGELVDLFAPGKTVPSAGIASNFAVVNMSGTSMSSPLTAGVAALYLEAFPAASPASVSAAIVNNATNGEVIDADPWGGYYTVNKLLYSFFVPPPPHIFVFNSSNQTVNEGVGAVTITVNRSGLDLPAVTVDYATSDGTAGQYGDYTTALGKISFAAGQTSKTFQIFITDDGYVENNESFTVRLSNPTGGASLGVPNTTTITIVSNDSVNSQPIDNAGFFVRQHYIDFLNREPDPPGLAFWTGEITMCSDPGNRLPGESEAQCVDRKRTNTSGAFYLSHEFQNSANFLVRLNWGSLGKDRAPGRKCIAGQHAALDAVCRPLYLQYMADMHVLTQEIVANNQLQPNAMTANRHTLTNQFITRADFLAQYPANMPADQYVDKLVTFTGVPLLPEERTALINDYNSPGSSCSGLSNGRACVLYKIVDGTTTIANGALQFNTRYGQAYYDKEFNPVFVFVEYLGYLRRNPDQGGYDFWLGKLNFYGNFIDAEMVRAFLLSEEYRQRFGPN